ncbi:hypothetical protein FB567DRAFT_44885 [Paraphoma chrysanthemicola]|uniref:Uncharacterized protein n=1 Tax=Paraphoma chrysanthemicola TaxID=798071 RepID=A0A8K0RK35_9PLEO|nr:hypothetical protein FB567DRAFT_44885 [Paraphoma chrysanthemicola]
MQRIPTLSEAAPASQSIIPETHSSTSAIICPLSAQFSCTLNHSMLAGAQECAARHISLPQCLRCGQHLRGLAFLSQFQVCRDLARSQVAPDVNNPHQLLYSSHAYEPRIQHSLILGDNCVVAVRVGDCMFRLQNTINVYFEDIIANVGFKKMYPESSDLRVDADTANSIMNMTNPSAMSADHVDRLSAVWKTESILGPLAQMLRCLEGAPIQASQKYCRKERDHAIWSAANILEAMFCIVLHVRTSEGTSYLLHSLDAV